MKKQRWELPLSVDRAALVASFTAQLIRDVDEMVRHQRLLVNAQEACIIAAKAGVLSKELEEQLARSQVQLAVAVTMVAQARGLMLEAQQLPAEPLPYVPPATPLPPKALTEAQQWDALEAEVAELGTRVKS